MSARDEPKWHPIGQPTDADRAYVSPSAQQLDGLARAWRTQRAKLEQTSPENLREFMGRLVRSWAIETGILERLYDLDEGATKTLIEHGFRSDFVERSATSMEPDALMRVLRDHQAAAEMVLTVVSEERPLSKHFIRELHQLLTRNQTHTEAMTADGRSIDVPMLHGAFKAMPNNPMRPDGVMHEYAPPEQVEVEVDRLVEGYAQLGGSSVAVAAAWLHHRFTQIHPFQDGNGRVARALTNYVFIKAGLFPLVVHRADRVAYIAALERADDGELGDLTDLFAEIQTRTVLEALTVAKDEEERGRRSAIDSVVSKLASRFGERIHDRENVLRGVNDVALRLRDAGLEHLRAKAEEAADEINQVGMGLRIYADFGGRDKGSEHFWKTQLIDTANELGYWINFAEGQYWLRVAVNGAPVEMRFVASIHHVGHELSGVMRAGAFVEFEVPSVILGGSKQEATNPSDRIRYGCTPTLFSITWQSEFDDVWPAFQVWLEESYAMALRYWVDLF